MRIACKICGKVFNTANNGKYCTSCIDRICSQYSEYLSQPKRVYLKSCMVCGKPIKRGAHTSSLRGRATTCSEDCHHALVYITQIYRANRANQLRKKRRGLKPKTEGRSLLAIREDEARKLGISYGEYMARLYMAAERT